ncbi:MAG: hypothetical protein PHF84_01650 [bacterium]|nr:hypothetical protein [bacterium]
MVPFFLYAQDNLILAVLDFNTEKDLPVNLGKDLADLVRARIPQYSNLQLIERSRMLEVLKVRDLQAESCMDIACTATIGKALSCSRIIIGKAGRFGDLYTLIIRTIDTEKGKGEYTRSLVVKSLDEMPKEINTYVNNLYKIFMKIPLEKRSSSIAPITVPKSELEKGQDSIRNIKTWMWVTGISGGILGSAALYGLLVSNRYYDDSNKKYEEYKSSVYRAEAQTLHQETDDLMKKGDTARLIAYIGAGGLVICGSLFLYEHYVKNKYEKRVAELQKEPKKTTLFFAPTRDHFSLGLIHLF